jgi:putative transposase
MELANRKVTYRLYPTASQESRMHEVKELHRQLYNAALQERIDAYKKGVTITKGNQEKSLTIIRAEHEEYRALNAQSCQVTLKRLDDAYKHFFRRVGLGQTPGFPRFKSSNRFRGWGYKKHCDGFKLESGDKMSHGRLRLSGIGLIRMRGKAKTVGIPKTCEILRSRLYRLQLTS